eukprot:363859-Chlamydomonas_euryale.AAC.5
MLSRPVQDQSRALHRRQAGSVAVLLAAAAVAAAAAATRRHPAASQGLPRAASRQAVAVDPSCGQKPALRATSKYAPVGHTTEGMPHAPQQARGPKRTKQRSMCHQIQSIGRAACHRRKCNAYRHSHTQYSLKGECRGCFGRLCATPGGCPRCSCHVYRHSHPTNLERSAVAGGAALGACVPH